MFCLEQNEHDRLKTIDPIVGQTIEISEDDVTVNLTLTILFLPFFRPQAITLNFTNAGFVALARVYALNGHLLRGSGCLKSWLYNSRMDEMDRIDQIDQFVFYLARTCQVVKLCQAVCEVLCTQMSQINYMTP